MHSLLSKVAKPIIAVSLGVFVYKQYILMYNCLNKNYTRDV